MADDCHPLFPPKDDDEDPPEVGYINVTRHEGGAAIWSPRRFEAGELDSLEQLHELFGGGTYELIARGLDNKHITARRAYKLPGASKPLAGEVAAPPPAAQPFPMMPQQSPAGNLLPLFATLGPLVLQWMTGQQQMQQLQLKQSSDLLALMMTNSQSGSREHVQAMQALHDRSMQELATILNAKNAGGDGGGGGPGGGSFQEGIAWYREFMDGAREQLASMQGEGGGQDDLQKTLEQAIKGFELFQQMQNASKNSPPIGGAS